jgi:hypothetical protein
MSVESGLWKGEREDSHPRSSSLCDFLRKRLDAVRSCLRTIEESASREHGDQDTQEPICEGAQ